MLHAVPRTPQPMRQPEWLTQLEALVERYDTYAETSRRLGCTATHVGEMMAGRRQNPSPKLREKIASVYHNPSTPRLKYEPRIFRLDEKALPKAVAREDAEAAVLAALQVVTGIERMLAPEHREAVGQTAEEAIAAAQEFCRVARARLTTHAKL